MLFEELSNREWALLAPIVSDKPRTYLSPRGRPRLEPRVVVNAILWILTTGNPWSSLPDHYPSIPTCRRRFEMWLLSGALGEMIRLLSQTGRTFACIPECSPVTTRSATQSGPRTLCKDGLRGVRWTSAGCWVAAPGATSDQNAGGPFSEITRQLSGQAIDAPVRIDSRATIAASQLRQARDSIWMGLASRGIRIADERGYVIYCAADPVGDEFRTWVEITRNGTRVARSGLIGPRFADFDAAKTHGHEWACKWIDWQSHTETAARTSQLPVVARPLVAHPVAEPVMQGEYDEAGEDSALSAS
jgi:transposase